MAGYATGAENDPGKEEEEENAEGNCKRQATNPIGGSSGWEKEIVTMARSERAVNLARYATGLANEPREEKEEENAAKNCKKTARNPVGVNRGWENENAPTLDPSTLGIQKGAAGRFTKQATMLTAEVNTPITGTK